MDLGWYGDQDIVAAVDFLTEQPDVEPGRIGVLGLSMGGEEAIGAAAADPRIRAVVAEGATARTAADKERWLPGGVSGALQRALDRYTFGVTDLLTPASSPNPLGESVAASDADFLLVTAGQVPDEKRAADSLEAAAPARVQVLEVPDATHTDGLDTAPQEWTEAVLGFLDAHLAPS
jgi:dienelactone hydrolase